MSNYNSWQMAGYRPTLHELQDQRHALNMRLLLAVQSRDAKTQEALEQALSAVNAKIDDMNGAGRAVPAGGERK